MGNNASKRKSSSKNNNNQNIENLKPTENESPVNKEIESTPITTEQIPSSTTQDNNEEQPPPPPEIPANESNETKNEEPEKPKVEEEEKPITTVVIQDEPPQVSSPEPNIVNSNNDEQVEKPHLEEIDEEVPNEPQSIENTEDKVELNLDNEGKDVVEKQDQVVGETSPPITIVDEDGAPIDRVRRPTRAEVELTNLFKGEDNKMELPPDYQPKEMNLEEMYQQDLPKRSLSRKKSLRMKFYNTFSKKRSAKYESELAAAEAEQSASNGSNNSSSGNKKKLNRTQSTMPTNFSRSADSVPTGAEGNEPGIEPNVDKKKKYLTLSGRMNTLRKIIFTPPEPKDKDIEEIKEKLKEEEAKKIAEQKEEKPKKKSIFNSEDIARYGTYITKEVGHVFMFSGQCGSAYFF